MSLEDNNKSNSFFSVFNSGNGGGGGGGEVNTASNLGTGLGVYKQKVLEDLQFRSLLEGKGINLTYSVSNDEIEIAQEVGVVGIGDGTGFYTFYPDINTALASSVAGQTIKLFADIIETNPVSIVLRNGVDIDLNGFTYTLNSSDATNMITDTLEIVDVSIRNGNLIRLNAVPTTGQNGLAINITRSSSVVSLDDNVYVENEGNVVLNMERGGTINGGLFIGGSITYSASAYLNGFVNKAFFRVTQQVVNGATCTNCIFYNNSASGVALYNVARAFNCDIQSRGQNYNQSELWNCTIKNNDGSALSNNGGFIYNCTIRGKSGEAIGVTDAVVKCIGFTRVDNSVIYAETGIAISLEDSELRNSSVFSQNGANGVVKAQLNAYISNNSIYNGHNLPNRSGINISQTDFSGVIIVGNEIRVIHPSSYGINGVKCDAYIVNNSFLGADITINTINIANKQVITPDLYGNIKIG